MSARLAAGLAVLLASLVGVASAAAAPKVTVTTACFTATGPDGKSYAIDGRRFTVGRPSAATPAIVLVHGVQSDARVWDLTPSWSVARPLARAGYVVIAYDRLGYRNSAYTGKGGGKALTVAAQQSVLHDLVRRLHGGRYRVGAPSRTCRKPAALGPTAYESRRVAIVGHSSGGFIVSSYPGKYHDVAAMVQANAPSGMSSTDPPGNAALVSVTAPPAHGAMDDQFGPIGDTANDGKPPRRPAGTAVALPTRTACEEFDLWRPGAIKSVATALCNPAAATPTPSGETASYINQVALNTGLIKKTGKIPVLLAGADHDGIMPGDANALELSAWQENCGCDVSQFVLTDTGHAFMAHQSLRQWTAKVIAWLHGHAI